MTPEQLLSAVPIPLVLIRSDRCIEGINSAAETLLGARLVNHPYSTVFREPAIVKRIEAAFEKGTTGKARYRKTVGGRRLLFRAAVSPLPDGDGVLVSLLDVTAAKTAGKIRTDFVANVSHELRTPLTALSGIVETLQGAAREDPGARDQFLKLMAKEAARMNRLVQDLLSLSQVENIEHKRAKDPLDLCTAIQSAVASLEKQAQKQGTVLEVRGCEEGIIVPGDLDQLRQVFNNLIENAIKYGGEGEQVSIIITRENHQPLVRGPGVRVDVIDQGEGIAAGHLARLTERFYRVDKHRSRDMGGTGLGLAIVKHIVNRHRGRLRINSESGEGSRFTIYLPLR